VPDSADASDNGRSWRRVQWWCATEAGQEHVLDKSLVDLTALGGDADACDGRGQGRRRARTHEACAVCARAGWNRSYEFFWDHPDPNRKRSFITSQPRATKGRSKQEMGVSPRDKMHTEWFAPQVYHGKWTFNRRDGQGMGGIPLGELEASSVREPGTGRLWLLHKKVFRYKWDPGLKAMAADSFQRVPVCSDCKHALQGEKPTLPKFALANDLWMGRLPPQLGLLSTGAWMLLALARPLVKMVNCYPSGKKAGDMDPNHCTKAYIGNVAAFAHQDGGPLLQSLPPRRQASHSFTYTFVCTGGRIMFAVGALVLCISLSCYLISAL